MQPYRIEFAIAVKPAVKKFIASKHSVEPFVVTTSNYFGSYLHNCLTKVKGRPVKEFKKLDPLIYSDKLIVSLTEDMYRRYGWYISTNKQYYFNQMVQDMMHEQFTYFMDINTNDLGIRQHNAFLDFRERIGLSEDELALKTMEKRWERERKRAIA